MTDIYYYGSETDWKVIDIGSYNYLTNARIHYNSTGPENSNTFTEVHQLKSWDVFTNTVYFHDGVSYPRVSEDAVDLDNLLNCWVICTLCNLDSNIVLISMEKLESKTETVIKTLQTYDVFTNTVYFTDGTSYLLGENVSVDLDHLLNTQVICTIESDPIKGIHITAIEEYIDPTTITTARITGQNTVKVKNDTTLTAKIHLTFELTTPVEWTVDDASILGFVDADGAIVDHITTNLSDNTPRDFTISQDIRGLKAGTATVTFKLTYGARHSIKIQVYEDGSKELKHLTLEWVRAYEGYTDAVEKVLKDNKNTVSTLSIIQQAEILKQSDAQSKNKVITFEEQYVRDDVIRDYVYRSVAEFLAENTSKAIGLGNVSTSDDIKGANDIAKAIYSSFDTQSYTYKYGGNITITISGFSPSSTHFRTISYKKGSSNSYRVAYFVSNQETTNKAIQEYLKELKDLEKNYFKEAYNQMKKSIFSKSLNDLIKSGIDSALTPFFAEMEKIGLGKVNIALDTILDYYGYVKGFLDISNADPVSAANKLSSMKTIYFESSDIKDDAVKTAMKVLDAATSALNNAVEQYKDTGKIDLKLTFSDFLSDTFDGIKTSFMCPVNISIYDVEGGQVGYVGENDIWFDDSVIYVEKYGDTKTIYANNTSLTFVLVGTDDGTLNCTFEEYTNGESLGRINYYDIELYDGKQIEVSAPAENLLSNNLTVISEGDVLPPNEILSQYDYSDATVTITCKSNTSGGKIFGEGTYVRGDLVKLQAIADEGYCFYGWIEANDALASASNVYEFTAREDVDLLAVFGLAPENDFPNVDSMYFVNLDPGDGYVYIDYTITMEDGRVSSLPDAEYEGYTFSGWYTAPAGGDQVTVNTVFHNDTTVYAHWTKNDASDTPNYPGNWGGYYDAGYSSSSSSNPSYQIAVSKVSNGTVTVTPKSAESGSKVTITAKPDDGYTIGSVTVTDSKGNPVAVTDNGTGTYTFIMPSSKVTVDVTFVPVKGESSEDPWVNPFTDVSPTDWFYPSVQYVHKNGLMTGDSSTTIFNPAGTMTRAMVWTVLGRMAGADVNGTGNEWYAKAQTWAVMNNVSDGTNPNNAISRQELMTMLWRYVDSPSAMADLSQFSDYADIADWANSAMQWAVSTGLIIGDNGRLNPVGDAKRYEVATIFMRFCENIIE